MPAADELNAGVVSTHGKRRVVLRGVVDDYDRRRLRKGAKLGERGQQPLSAVARGDHDRRYGHAGLRDPMPLATWSGNPRRGRSRPRHRVRFSASVRYVSIGPSWDPPPAPRAGRAEGRFVTMTAGAT